MISANTTPHHLTHLGWTPFFQTQLEAIAAENPAPARVIGVRKNSFRINDGQDERLAFLSGKLKHDALYPVTGDWVLMTSQVISQVLARQNTLSRGASGARHALGAQPQKEQVIAANLDAVFIVSGLDRDFNLRRIERYLTLIYNCGLNPVIVLTKADLHPDPAPFVREVEAVAFGVPVHLVSAADQQGLSDLAPYLGFGRTITLVGSSGAGKSTLINRLCGAQVQATAAISTQVGKGRHTTTTRDLIALPQGGMIIDNPGIREIAFWDTENGTTSAFPDIDRLAMDCRFADCGHFHEPGCRVLEAVAQGELPPERLENFRKMKRELDFLAQRQHKSANRVEKERWKGVAMKIRAMTPKGY